MLQSYRRRLLCAASATTATDPEALRKISRDDLLLLLRRKDEEVVNLKKIHELSLRRTELEHRRHLQEYEEKATMLEEGVNRFAVDTSNNAAWGMSTTMKKYEQSVFNEQVKWYSFLTGISCFWMFLIYAYPLNEDRMYKEWPRKM